LNYLENRLIFLCFILEEEDKMCWREGYSSKIFYEFKRIQKNVSKCQKYSCKMMSFLVK
jgi:hypothetical protein